MKVFFGYLDAGTGSLIIQAAVGALVAVGVFFKNFRNRIVGIFKRSNTATEPTASEVNKTKTPTKKATTTKTKAK